MKPIHATVALAVGLTLSHDASARGRRGALSSSSKPNIEARKKAVEEAQRKVNQEEAKRTSQPLPPNLPSGAPVPKSQEQIKAEADLAQTNQDLAAARDAAEEQPNGSPLTVGTLLGVGVPLYDVSSYAVRDSVVYRKYKDETWDYIQPAAYVLPTIAIWSNDKGTAVSAVVPFGLTGKGRDIKDLQIGAGVSMGFPVGQSAEVGLALALVWNQTPVLSDAQRQSYKTRTALPAGESDQFDTRLRPTATLGIYVTPVF